MVLVDEGIRYHKGGSLRIGKARRAINPRLHRAFSAVNSWLEKDGNVEACSLVQRVIRRRRLMGSNMYFRDLSV